MWDYKDQRVPDPHAPPYMAKNQTFYVGQKVLIRKGEELLLLIDPRFGLDLPGGRIQEGEKDLIDSMQREIEEEIGLIVEIGAPAITWTWQIKVEQHPVFLVGYESKYISGEIKLSTEHSEFHWVTKETYNNFAAKYRKENPELYGAIEQYFNR